MFFRMLEKTKAMSNEMFDQQKAKENDRFELCKRNIQNLLDYFCEKDVAKILKEMNETNIEHLTAMGEEQREKLSKELTDLCSDTERHIGTRHFYCWQKLDSYKRNLTYLEYNIEMHCDRFPKFVDKELKKFESHVESQSF